MGDPREIRPEREDLSTIRQSASDTIQPSWTEVEGGTQQGPATAPDGASTLRRPEDASTYGPDDGGVPPRASTQAGPEAEATIHHQTPVFGLGSAQGMTGSGEIRPGQVLFDRYIVEKQIGSGGMGTVWAIRHMVLSVPRALKLIRPQIAFDPKTRADFRREATIMANLHHPNALLVHDAQIGSDLAYIEMELLEGDSIEKLLEAGRPMPLDWVTRILMQLCELLEFVHGKGIVHRDLKPSNLMLLKGHAAGQEFLKVLDFGIAKSLNPDTVTSDDIQTGTGAARFTPHYASPEQVGGTKEADPRSDLYSVGVILYEFLTGHRPFSEPGLVYQHLCVPAPSFASRNPHAKVPPGVEAVVLSCLEKDIKLRPQSARELADRFLEAVERTGLAVTIPSTSRTRWPERRTAVDPTRWSVDDVGTKETPKGRHGPTLKVAAVVVLILLALALPSWPVLSLIRRGTFAPVAPNADPSIPSKAPDPARIADEVAPRPLSFGYRADPNVRRINGWPNEITEENTGHHFVYFADGIYLPDGYSPEDRADLVNGWPRVLVREGRGGGRFIRIEGGTFEMGGLIPADDAPKDAPGDRPTHTVTLPDYYIQETEVTNAQMSVFYDQMATIRSPAWDKYFDSLRLSAKNRARLPYLPATFVTRRTVAQYARFVGGRVPTEAEWEFAARSRGERRLYVWGDDQATTEMTNINNAESVNGSPIPLSDPGVYEKDRTEQGIVDMAGNVREWCFEAFTPYEASKVVQPDDPDLVLDPTKDYVVRGSSFSLDSDVAPTTARRYEQGGQEALDLGFRIVLRVPRDMRPRAAAAP